MERVVDPSSMEYIQSYSVDKMAYVDTFLPMILYDSALMRECQNNLFDLIELTQLRIEEACHHHPIQMFLVDVPQQQFTIF
jgi:hypothetical protein